MGTRADFYVGRGVNAEWLGSIAWDGNPGGIPDEIKNAEHGAQFTAAVTAFLLQRDDATQPELGWPWPWMDSRTTDYAYAFDDGKVWASGFGRAWFDANTVQDDETYMDGPKVAVFPNMKDRQRVVLGPRSGLMVLGRKE